MVEKKKVRRHVTAHVSRAQAVQEAEAMSNGKGRSRWIITVIIIALLGAGGWMIAQRVMPYAFDGAKSSSVEGIMMGEVAMGMPMIGGDSDLSAPPFAARDDVPMVKSLRAGVVEENFVTQDIVNDAENGIDRKVQKTGSAQIIVESISWTTERVNDIARESGGEVMYANFYTNERENVSGSMNVRVPVEAFDVAFKSLKSLGRVEHESVGTQDVTEQYIDLESRLINRKREEESIAKILERSGKIDEVLKVTRELARVRGQIERLEGQRRYLASRTDFSLITLSIQEDEKIITPDTAWRPITVAKQSLNRLMADAQEWVDNGIRFLVWFLPSFIAYIIVIIVLWHIVKKASTMFIARWERKQKNNAIKK